MLVVKNRNRSTGTVIIYVSIFMLVFAIFSSILPFSKASKKSVVEVMNDA
ncbi:hypothetical protein [Borreliella garinii]